MNFTLIDAEIAKTEKQIAALKVVRDMQADPEFARLVTDQLPKPSNNTVIRTRPVSLPRLEQFFLERDNAPATCREICIGLGAGDQSVRPLIRKHFDKFVQVTSPPERIKFMMAIPLEQPLSVT